MAINIAGANTYFARGNHPMARTWESFSQEDKTAAIAHAKRILCRILGRELCETASAITDNVREDLAAYEQALYTLRNAPGVTQGQQGVPGFVSNDPANPMDGRPADQGQLAPEARRYLTRPRENNMPGGVVEFGRG